MHPAVDRRRFIPKASFRPTDRLPAIHNHPNGSVTHWLKNVNDPEKETKVWRYAHYHSYTPWAAKRSILVSTLKKVDKMASDGDSLVSSAIPDVPFSVTSTVKLYGVLLVFGTVVRG